MFVVYCQKMFVHLFAQIKNVQTMSLDTATATITLRKYESRKNKDGEYPINLRVTYQRFSKYYTIKGESAKENEFAEIMSLYSKGDNAKRRKRFETIQKRAKKVIDELDDFSFEAFEFDYLNKRPKAKTLQDYFEDKIAELESMGKYGSATPYKNTIKALTKYKSDISFKKITPKYLKAFEDWFLTEGKRVQKGSKPQGGSPTTVGIYMRNLRHIYKLAIADKVVSKKDYPFGQKKDNKYPIPKGDNKKKALSIDEVGLLMNYKGNDPLLMQSVKYWLFSYFCNGMNFSDILHLKWSSITDDNTLKFLRQKTKDTLQVKKEIEVVLLPQALQIIDELGVESKDPDGYIFPILANDMSKQDEVKAISLHINLTNRRLKRVAKEIGITEKISTYFARHTYATVTRDSGASTEFIAEQLGHKNLSVTQAYLDSFSTDTKKEFQNKLIPNA